MSAGLVTLTIERGANFDLELTYKDYTGAPVDVSAYDALLQVRKTYEDGELVVEFSSPGEITIVGAVITVSADSTVTVIEPGVYYYDFVLKNGTDVIRLIEGTVTVSPRVSIP